MQMSKNSRNYTKALYGLDAVVQRVPEDRWGAPTPCEDWTARDVVVHCIGVMNAVKSQIETAEMALPDTPDVGDDLLEAWNTARDETLEALDHEGVLAQQGNYWIGPGTVDDLLGFALWDPLTHSWDLSTAVGIDAAGSDELAAAAMPVIEGMAPMLRQLGHLGDPIEVPDNASAMSRFLGLAGRDPVS
jgi:uncharacterized protein (TIGR03086 family)